MMFGKITSVFKRLDEVFILGMRRWSISVLRIALGAVFFWFGILKVIQASPVAGIIEAAYPLFPEPGFINFLGIWEIIIGLGLIFKLGLRFTLALLWLQMAGTVVALFLAPSLFFQHSNIFLLTTEGEFVVKNLVLIASGLVIGGYEVQIKNVPDSGRLRSNNQSRSYLD